MYTIYADGKLLYAPSLSNEGFAVTSPKVEVELNKAGSAAFLIPPDNIMYSDIRKLKSVINVYDEDEEIFRGRVLHDEKGFYNVKDVYCEGELAYFLDSVVRPYSFQGSVEDLFKQYVNNHNSQVDDWKQFRIGQVTVTDPNDYITRESSDYSKSFDEMNAKLVNLLGGYLRPRLSNGIRYLDYVTDYGGVSDQVIEFGKNLLDISEYISAEDVFTVLIPIGAEQQDAEGNSAGRLTIESVNGGKDYIEDADAIKLFGRIVKVETWDDVTIASNLLKKGMDRLAEGIEMAVSLTIKAVDLHLLNIDTERIKLGDYIRVVSLPHGIDKYFLCSKISYDLVNPDKTEFTLGVTFTGLTDKQVNSTKMVQSTVSVAQSSAASAQNSADQANNAVQQVEQVISTMPTEYVKTSVFEAYKEDADQKYASSADIPSKVSELENDAAYLTEGQAKNNYVKTEIFNELVQRVETLERSGT